MGAAERLLAALTLASLPAAAAEPPCEQTWTPDALDGTLQQAEEAFSNLDIEQFIAAHDTAREQVACLDRAISTAVAARLHRIEGLRAFGERDVFSVRAFAAARALDPNYRFPDSLVPDSSPIYDDWDAMDLGAGGLVTLPEPVEGFLLIDGIPTRERPDAWPSVVQLMGSDDAPVFTAYLHHDAAAPAFEARPPPKPQGPGAPPELARGLPASQPRSPRVPLLVGAGASAVSTGVLVALGASSRAAFFDPSTPDAELDGLRARTNSLAAAATVTGVASVGLGVGVALTW